MESEVCKITSPLPSFPNLHWEEGSFSDALCLFSGGGGEHPECYWIEERRQLCRLRTRNSRHLPDCSLWFKIFSKVHGLAAGLKTFSIQRIWPARSPPPIWAVPQQCKSERKEAASQETRCIENVPRYRIRKQWCWYN